MYLAARQYYQLPEHFEAEWIVADILDTDSLMDAFAGADVVFHCAAVVSFHMHKKDDLMRTNVEGTHNVVNACLKTGVPKIIYTGSIAALGRKPGVTNYITEETQWEESSANTDYARSKYLGELEIWRGAEEGLQAAVLLPGVILGPADGERSSNSIYKLARRTGWFYPEGSSGFVGVTDVAKLLILLYENNLWNQKVLAVAENLSYADLFRSIAEWSGIKPPRFPLSGWVLNAISKVAWVLEKLHLPTPVPYQAVYNTATHSIYHSTRIQQLGPFTFEPVKEVNTKALAFLYNK